MEVERTRSIYQNSLYTFLNEDTYSEIRDFLGNIQEKDIVGEGVNALVVAHPTDESKIVKIGKPGKDDIINEARVHNLLYLYLKRLIDSNSYGLTDSIRIPRLEFGVNFNYFIIERIKGQSFKTKFYIHLYGEKLKHLGYSDSQIQNLSDIGLTKLLEKHSLQRLAHPNDTFLTRNEIQLEKLYKEWWEKEFHLSIFDEVKKVLMLLKDKFGIEVLDRNPGNFM